MTTTKSFSNRRQGIFISSLRKQSSFGIVSFIILFIAMVIPYLAEIPDHNLYQYYGNSATDYYADVFSAGVYRAEEVAYVVMVVLCIMAFACALSSARYLHSMKMTDLYHSLPVRREKLLLVNTGASMIAVLGPFVLLYVGVILWQMIGYGRYGWVGSWYWSHALMDFLTISIAVFVVYMLTTLIAVNVGTTFDALAISGVMGFFPTIVWAIAGAMWEFCTYGASFSFDYALRISPFLFFFERLNNVSYARASDHSFAYNYDYGAIAKIFGVWLLIGLAFGALAVFCYRRRKSELAEQTQPHGVLQTVIKCFAAYCGAAVFVAIFNDRPLPVQVIVILFSSVAIGLIAELIFSRGVRSIAKNLRVLAIAGAVYSLLFIGLNFDFFGAESYVPDTTSIESVNISYRGRFSDEVYPRYMDDGGYYWRSYDPLLTDTASLNLVREVHESVISDYQEGKTYDYYSNYFTLTYTLKNGKTVSRNYYDVTRETYQKLAKLENEPGFIQANHPIFWLESIPEWQTARLDASLSSATQTLITPLSLDRQASDKLIEALRIDMLAQTQEDIFSGRKVRGYLDLSFWSITSQSSPSNYSESPIISTSITITDNYTATIALLQQLDYGHLLKPDSSEIAEVRMTDVMDYYIYDNRVFKADEQYSYRLSDPYYEHDYKVFKVTDADEIANVVENGRDSFLLTQERAQSVLVMQFYDRNNVPLSTQFIAVNDLPAQMQNEVSAYLKERADTMGQSNDYDYGYNYAVETAVPIVMAEQDINITVEQTA